MNSLILIIAHAPLASALRECALHVFSDCADSLVAVDVVADASPEGVVKRARAALDHSATDRPVLVLTDVLGATPCNIAQSLVGARAAARLVSGVNLPMLLRAVSYRHEPLDILVQRAVVGGTQGVMQVTTHAPQNQTLALHDQSSKDHQQ